MAILREGILQDELSTCISNINLTEKKGRKDERNKEREKEKK